MTVGISAVDLPHDYSITRPRDARVPGGKGGGFFPGGIGTYVKYLDLTEDTRYLLDIDGAYMCASVRLENQQLIMHPHGYTPLLVDLTDTRSRERVSRLEIITNALTESTRWYTGAGLYREVSLWTGGDTETGTRLEPWDVFIKTPDLSTVCAQADVSSEKGGAVTVVCEVFDEDGAFVARAEENAVLSAGEKTRVNVKMTLENAKAWDSEHPYLYRARTTVKSADRALDTDERSFGVRTVKAVPGQGLLLNGQPVKLRGGCIHHDHAALGAADHEAACRRKLTILKNSGFNALRIAHNPPSTRLMEMCDRMGIFVMDEAFDCWNRLKGGATNYHLWFADWWERDLDAMVLRDRSHPSVIAYSLGNEIPESDGLSDGAVWTEKMAACVRALDDTRPVTSATYRISACAGAMDPPEIRKEFEQKYGTGIETWKDRTESYFAPLDMAGYNYMFLHYEEDHERFPDRVIWGSETHTLNFYSSWEKVMKYPYLVGDFTWTAYDNLGEVGTGRSMWARDGVMTPGAMVADYPWRACWQGDIDLCGFLRPQAYFRHAVWLGGWEPKIFTTHPEHYGEGFTGTAWHWYDVHDTWTFPEKYLGKPVRCEVYTEAPTVKWYLNGRFVGQSETAGAVSALDVPYEKGTLTAVAYRDGREIGRSSLETAGKTEQLLLCPETPSLKADGHDLCYVDITLADGQGRRVTEEKRALSAFADGAELLAVFSADPCNEDQYGSMNCHAFDGRAVAVLRTKTPGTVTLFVTADGLTGGKLEIKAE